MRAGRRPRHALHFRDFQHAHLRVTDRVREVIHVHALHIGLALLELKPLHVILLPLMDINRLRMHSRERRRKIHLADHFRLALALPGRINDHKIIRGHRPQAHRVRRISLLRPMPFPPAAVQESRLRQMLAKFLQIHAAESFLRRKRQLKRRALHVVHQNFQIVRLHVGVFRRAPEKIIRMLHDELIERRGRGHQHGAGRPAPPPGPSRALPRGRNRPRVPGHHRRVQRPDINPQFQRVRRHNAANPPVAQSTLDFPSLTGQIPAAISPDRFRFARLWTVRLLQIRKQHFRVQPAVGENNRLQFSREQLLRHARRLIQVASPDAEIAVHHRRIVENEKLLRRRRAVLFHHFHAALDQLLRQLARIRNRRRAANKLRPRPVKFRDAPKPAQHIRQVAPENSAVRVQLIQHDVFQVLEYARPLRVVWQDSRVQHVRVGQNYVPALADRPARVRRRVAVIGKHAKAVVQPHCQVVQFGQLVLCQRLGGEEVERARVRVLEDCVQHRQVVAQRLP